MEQPKTKNYDLIFDQVQHKITELNNIFKSLTRVDESANELREHAMNEISRFALSIRASKIDKDELNNFFTYPYCILPGGREGEAYLAIPKFIDAHFGWLHKVTPSYNIFLVNRYVDWLGELPQALKKELKFPDPLDVHLEGDYLVGPDIKKAQARFGDFIKKVEADRLLIDKSRHFEMLASLIKEGILPFIPRPVSKDDLVNRPVDFELRDYQDDAWQEFLRYSNVGVFHPPSTGKTFFAMWAMSKIKPPHVIFVPTRLLAEQWKERIESHTDLKPDEYEVLTYYAGIKSDKQYKLKIIDEAHHLPANEFSKLATVRSDYIIGLSATPQREDQREEFIFALTGKPVGLAWETFKKLGIIQNPPLHVWIVKNEKDRMNELERLLQEKRKTIIFCDSIALGQEVATKFDLPHVHGASIDRLAKIKDAPCTVVSRVGDEGISLPDIERVIEVSWLHGSRRQELQRFTRLLHGQTTTGEAHIIMTGLEYTNDHKRLFSIMDKGFKIVLHRQGIEDKVIRSMVEPGAIKVPKVRQPTSVQRISSKPVEAADVELSEKDYPLMKYAGIRKIFASLTKGQKEVLKFLLEVQNQNQSFNVNQLAMSLGYGNPRSLTANGMKSPLPFLVAKGYVKNEDGRYSQNLSQLTK